MKICIELPTWLGDSVMVTPALENLINFYIDPEITLIGSFEAIEALSNHPKIIKTFVRDKNYLNLYSFSKNLGEFDVFFSFRSAFRSKFLKFFIPSKRKFQFNKNRFLHGHQVEKYNNFVNESLEINKIANKLRLHKKSEIINNNKKLLGINPGASYGSAKRWHPKEFADVAFELSNKLSLIHI